MSPSDKESKKSNDSRSERHAWRREEDDQNLTKRLGRRVREHREKTNITMAEASELTGVPSATLSRIENNKMSPTFPTLMKLLTGLRMPLSDLIREDESFGSQTASIKTKLDPDAQQTETENYNYIPLHNHSPLTRQLQPLIIDIKAETLEEAGGLRGHSGVELAYVLSGSLEFHIEGEPVRVIEAGGSALFRSERPHAYLTRPNTATRILNIMVYDPIAQDEGLMDKFELRSIGEN